MVADLSLLSLPSKGEANGSQFCPSSAEGGSWSWNPSNDDSWEVKAFAEDTSNVMGATWPPRSYACIFCRREFKSAQALGGHMNVHRKDRARLNQSHLPNPHPNSTWASASSSPSPLIIPANQELAANTRLCTVHYQFPRADGIYVPGKMNSRAHDSSSSSFISIPPYSSNAVPYPPNTNLRRRSYPQGTFDRSTQWIPREGQATVDRSTQWIQREGQGVAVYIAGKSDGFRSMDFKENVKEELDLELRLGK